MKLVCPIYKNSELNSLVGYVDSVILMVPHYSYIYDNLDLDSAIEFCKKNNIETILSITRVFMENELNEIADFIKKHKNFKFLISDLGVLETMMDLGLEKNIIYDPTTLVCNSMDLNIYASLGLNAVGMSSEIPINDIKLAYRVTKAPIFYHVFGRKLMYYSKRKLLSVYKEYRNVDFKNDNLSLVEEKRDYHIPIFENENGTYCFRHYHISLLNEINDLNFLEYAYLESLTLDNKTFVEILKIYKLVIQNKISIDEGEESINKLGLTIDDGFAYNDTVHIKEKIIQWEK